MEIASRIVPMLLRGKDARDDVITGILSNYEINPRNYNSVRRDVF